jgi:hypothetical protein
MASAVHNLFRSTHGQKKMIVGQLENDARWSGTVKYNVGAQKSRVKSGAALLHAANRIRRLRKNNKIEFHAHRAGGGGAHLNLVTGRVFVRRERE